MGKYDKEYLRGPSAESDLEAFMNRVAPQATAQASMPRPFGRINFDEIDPVGSQRSFFRSKPASYSEISVNQTQFRPTSANFINISKRTIQAALHSQRLETVFKTPVIGRTLQSLSEVSQRVQYTTQKRLVQSQPLVNQVAALAQKLFAEIARNPESFVKLSQSETTALNGAKATVSPQNAADPKAALRLMAINAMNQAYTPKSVDVPKTHVIYQNGVASLQGAINRLDDDRKKHQFNLQKRLSELGYSADEQAKLSPVIKNNSRLEEYIKNGTVSSRKDLDSVLGSLTSNVKSKQLQ